MTARAKIPALSRNEVSHRPQAVHLDRHCEGIKMMLMVWWGKEAILKRESRSPTLSQRTWLRQGGGWSQEINDFERLSVCWHSLTSKKNVYNKYWITWKSQAIRDERNKTRDRRGCSPASTWRQLEQDQITTGTKSLENSKREYHRYLGASRPLLNIRPEITRWDR